MVLYRRNWVPGGTYFFTVTLRDRSSGLLVQYIDHLRHAFRTTHRERPFRLEAIVILPDHLHASARSQVSTLHSYATSQSSEVSDKEAAQIAIGSASTIADWNTYRA